MIHLFYSSHHIFINFISAASKVDLSQEKDKYRDYRFTKWMSKNIKLQGIPPSAFYSEPNKHLIEDYVRYCFIKVSLSMRK